MTATDQDSLIALANQYQKIPDGFADLVVIYLLGLWNENL